MKCCKFVPWQDEVLARNKHVTNNRTNIDRPKPDWVEQQRQRQRQPKLNFSQPFGLAKLSGMSSQQLKTYSKTTRHVFSPFRAPLPTSHDRWLPLCAVKSPLLLHKGRTNGQPFGFLAHGLAYTCCQLLGYLLMCCFCCCHQQQFMFMALPLAGKCQVWPSVSRGPFNGSESRILFSLFYICFK